MSYINNILKSSQDEPVPTTSQFELKLLNNIIQIKLPPPTQSTFLPLKICSTFSWCSTLKLSKLNYRKCCQKIFALKSKKRAMFNR